MKQCLHYKISILDVCYFSINTKIYEFDHEITVNIIEL